jgi:hypothetical protein
MLAQTRKNLAHYADVEMPHRFGGAFLWIACICSVTLSYQDRVVQVLHQGVHVDPVGHCALADVLKARNCASNTPQTVPEKDVNRVRILADHITNGHLC